MLTPLSLKDSKDWYVNQQELGVISPQGVYARLGEGGFLAFGRETPIVYSVLDETKHTWKKVIESAGLTKLEEILQDPTGVPSSKRQTAPLLLDLLRTPRRIIESAGDKLVIELSQREQYSCIGIDDISDEYINQQLELNLLPKKGRLKGSEKLAFLAYNSQKRQAGIALRDFHQNPSEEARRRIQAHLDEASNYFGLIFQGNQGLVNSQWSLQSKKRRYDQDLFHDCITSKLPDAVNGFDASRGFAFSTYFCNIVWKEFYRRESIASRMPHQGSLDKPRNGDGDWSFLHFLDSGEKRPSEIVMGEELKDWLAEVLDPNAEILSEIESIILKARFFGSKTLEAVGREVGLTKERVRQIEKQALEKAREYLEEVTI